VVRLRKVIDGEQTGISKNINWKGGGSFVYLELKKYNQTFIEQIEALKPDGTNEEKRFVELFSRRFEGNQD